MKASPLIGEDEIFVRMSLTERLQHGVVLVVFVLLILTGLPLLLHGLKVFKWVFSPEKSFYGRGLIHRAAAVGLIAAAVWHAASVAFTPRGRQYLRDMRPRVKDARDALQSLGFNLGLSRYLLRRGLGRTFFKRHPFWLFETAPLFERYSFIEKFEYGALVWGTLIMILSGFFMWRVDLSLRLFPLWVHNIFILVHGYEAVLALLAILTWHMYNVHLNPEDFPMSKVWLNGRMTGREMRLRHPLEYRRVHEERLEQKRKEPPAGRTSAGGRKPSVTKRSAKRA
jgi:cytochrome b subunit of formate dehydrogenase